MLLQCLFLYDQYTTLLSVDNAVMVDNNPVWYSLEVVNWHTNLKYILIDTQHLLYMGVVVLFFIFTVYEAAYMNVIVLPLTEYHSEIAKKRKEKKCSFFVTILNISK